MKEAGHLDRVLLSHDAGWYHVGEPGGGEYRPYDTLMADFVPALRAAGVSEAEVRRLTVDNPRAAFTVQVRPHGKSLGRAHGVVDRGDEAKYPGAFPPNSLASHRHDIGPTRHAPGLPGPRPHPRGTGRRPTAHASDARDAAAPRTFAAPGFEAEGVEALFYEGMPWKGSRPASSPRSACRRSSRGRSARRWSWSTAAAARRSTTGCGSGSSRGYAAIAMDTCGRSQRDVRQVGAPRRRRAAGGATVSTSRRRPPRTSGPTTPSPTRSSPIRCSAAPDVDAERIGVTGISWGGYLTCIVAGLDDRLKFAVPVYGCGFLGDNPSGADGFDEDGRAGPERG